MLMVAGLASGHVIARAAESAPLQSQESEPAQEQNAQEKTKQVGASKDEEASQDEKAPTLRVGDPAPKLYVEKWVKGEAIESFEAGKVYVVEFWATWCGPCIQSIPHLSSLQKKYAEKGLVVVGISSDEENGLSDVTSFVKKQGDKMAYRVAWDDAGRSGAAWMQAAGKRGIPQAFIINREGKLAYEGHPMAMDDALAQIIDGTWDIELAKKQQQLQAKLDAMQQRFAELSQKGKINQGVEELTKGLRETPSLGVHLVGPIYALHAQTLDDVEAANAFAKDMIEGLLKDDAQSLNALAWTIADAGDVEGRDLDLALKAATNASKLSSTDASIIDTLAAVHAAKKDWKSAMTTQQRAIDLAKDDETKERYTETRERYKRLAK